MIDFSWYFTKHSVLCMISPIFKTILRILFLYFALQTPPKKGGFQKSVFSQGHPPSEGRTWDPSTDRSDSTASSSFLLTTMSNTRKQLEYKPERDKLHERYR